MKYNKSWIIVDQRLGRRLFKMGRGDDSLSGIASTEGVWGDKPHDQSRSGGERGRGGGG